MQGRRVRADGLRTLRTLAASVLLAATCATALPAADAEARAKQRRAAAEKVSAKTLAARLQGARTTPRRMAAIVKTMDALGIGVYTSKGKVVVRGAERRIDDLYLYRFQVRGLAGALARKQRFSVADLRQGLVASGIPAARLPADDAALARAISEATRAAARRPRDRRALGPLLVRELGLRGTPKVDTAQLKATDTVDVLQRTLIYADVAAYASRSAGKRTASMAVAGRRPRRKLRDRSLCETISRRAPRDDAQRLGRWIAETLLGATPAGAALDGVVKPLGDWWHASILGLYMDYQPVQTGQVHETAYGPVGHVGHTHQAGQTLAFRVGAQLLYDIDEKDVKCGKLAGIKFPNDGKAGPVKGIPIDWDPVAPGLVTGARGDFARLMQHGTLIKKDDETNEHGIAELIIKPHDEVVPTAGAVIKDIGVIQPGAQLIAPFGNETAERWEKFLPRLATMSWTVEFHEQYVFDVEIEGTQHSSYVSRRSGPYEHDCDVNWDRSGTQTIFFATNQPMQVVFFVPPGSPDPDGFRPGSPSQPYTPYIPMPVEADFERQSTSKTEGNPECEAGGSGGGEPPPPPRPPDCGLKETSLQTQLEYTGLVTPDRPFLLRGEQLEESPYKNCPFGGQYSQKLLDASGVGRLGPAELRDTSTQLFLFAGKNSDSRDNSYEEGQKVNESRSSTSIDWTLSLRRRGAPR